MKELKLEYFCTITAHFFGNDFHYQSLILSFRKFEKSHNSENIGKFLSKQLVKLNIEDKIVSITTDNEAAVAKACSKLGNSSVRISCMCHNLNLVVKNGLKLWIKPKKSVLK